MWYHMGKGALGWDNRKSRKQFPFIFLISVWIGLGQASPSSVSLLSFLMLCGMSDLGILRWLLGKLSSGSLSFYMRNSEMGR